MNQLIKKIRKHGLLKSIKRLTYRLLSRLVHHQFNLHYFLRRSMGQPVIKEVNGFKMWLDLSKDYGLSRELFIYGRREHTSTKELITGKWLKTGDIALDIGANIGYYALIESKLVGPTGQVYAVEPVQKNFRTLQKNIDLNNIKNIQTFNMAVGDQNGETTIFVGQKGNWSSVIFDPNKNFIGQEKITLTTVDHFLDQRQTPRLIRMDVEGYEHAIIKGMPETLKKDIILLIEIHPTILTKDQINEMFDLLKANGFTHTKAIFDPPLRTLKPNGQKRFGSEWLINQLTTKEERNPEHPLDLTIDELKDLVLTKNRHIHSFIYKHQAN